MGLHSVSIFRATFIALLTGVGPITISAHAQSVNPPPEDEASLPDIIVTAQKRDERLQNVPIAITAVTSEQLSQRGVTDLTRLSGLAPNLSITNATSAGVGTSATAQIFIRGIGQEDVLPTADPGVGIYINDVYLGRVTGSVLQFLDVDKIEVLRGPQGTLFGRNTIGGAISVHTADPTGELGARGTVTYGSDDLVDARATLSLPGSDQYGANISLFRRFRDRLGTSSSEPSADFGNENKTGAALKFVAKPSEAVKIAIAADYSRQRQDAAPQVLGSIDDPANAAVGLYNAFSPLTGAEPFTAALIGKSLYGNSAQTAGRDDYDVRGVSGKIDWRLNDALALRSITAYRNSDVDFATDPDSSAASLLLTSTSIRQHQYSQELQALIDLPAFRGVVGAFLFKEKSDWADVTDIFSGYSAFFSQLPPTTPIPAPPPFNTAGALAAAFDQSVTSINRLNSDNWAAFSQGTIDITAKLGVTVGLRYSDERKTFDVRSFSPNSSRIIIPQTRLRDDWSSVTPKAVISYEIASDMLSYASYARGFKSGTFNGRANLGRGLGAVDPETADTFELGLKSLLDHRRVRMNIAGYYTRYSNKQLTVSAADPITGAPTVFVANAARARIYGVEVETLARLADGLEIGGTYGLANSRVEQASPVAIANGIDPGNPLPKTPQHQVTTFASYTLGTLIGAWTGRVDYRWQSAMFHDAKASPSSREPAYDIVDLRLSYMPRGDHLTVSLFANNVFDATYALQRSAISSLGFTTINYARRRELGVSAAFQF